MSSKFTLTIKSSAYSIEDKLITWPIVRETKKAILVETPGGDLWLPRWRFDRAKYYLAEVPKLIELLANISASAESSIVPVTRVGPGKTEKSAKFKVIVSENMNFEGAEVLKTRVRIFTLPLSQILNNDRLMFAPVWLVKGHLGKGENLANRVWPGLAKITDEIEQVAANLRQQAEDKNAEIERRKLKERAAWEGEQRKREEDLKRLNAALEKDGEAALFFCKRKFTLAALAQCGVHLNGWPTWPPNPQATHELSILGAIVEFARAHPKFAVWRAKVGNQIFEETIKPKKIREPDKVVSNAYVEWVEWGGTAKKRIKVEQAEHGCTVSFFGKKRQIVLPDGSVITKMEVPNLKIYSNDGDDIRQFAPVIAA